MDLGVFQKKNFMKGIYMRVSGGYWVVVNTALILYCGGGTPFYQKVEHFTLEAFRLQGPNVISFQLETGGQRWHVGGFYIASDNALTIDDVITITIKWFRGADILVAGDFNADLAEPERNARN